MDTHALIWYLISDKKLSKPALTIFRAAEQGESWLLLPSIVLAELYFANRHYFEVLLAYMTLYYQVGEC